VEEFIEAWQVFCAEAAKKWPALFSDKNLYKISPNQLSRPTYSFEAALQMQMRSLDAQLAVHVVLKKFCPTVYLRMWKLLDTMKNIPTSEDQNYIARRLLDIEWDFTSLADADSLFMQSVSSYYFVLDFDCLQ